MINSKQMLQYYLEQDEIARFKKKTGFKDKLLKGDLWRFNVILRKLEYYTNTQKVCRKYLYKVKMKRISQKLGYTIPINVFGPGLCIVHRGTVVVNDKCQIGKNCRIHVCVNIGANGDDRAPRLGDNVYIGPGAKIFGDICLGNNIKIGANAVVNKSFSDDNITIVGVPAVTIKSNTSDSIDYRV